MPGMSCWRSLSASIMTESPIAVTTPWLNPGAAGGSGGDVSGPSAPIVATTGDVTAGVAVVAVVVGAATVDFDGVPPRSAWPEEIPLCRSALGAGLAQPASPTAMKTAT